MGDKPGIETMFDAIESGKPDFESQDILAWACARAKEDPQYVKHICDRYHRRLNAEKLERANAIGRHK